MLDEYHPLAKTQPSAEPIPNDLEGRAILDHGSNDIVPALSLKSTVDPSLIAPNLLCGPRLSRRRGHNLASLPFQATKDLLCVLLVVGAARQVAKKLHMRDVGCRVHRSDVPSKTNCGLSC
ncbi:hypothetical protein FBZ93_1289 [Bradyrhizobium macuxiense]|uniref:Uncharacterized protein n=1 Tax=Bradyrhizobium macuxiense TaxID=1755647 RepID=A0A560KUE4_9BRAD|nr:hypothetical protein FBZ93_1289 [Bradyrhizobium macuxiense]